MTSYVAIANGEIDQDSPVTQALMTALRDNPIAITEGAVGAPRIVLSAIRDGLGTAAGTEVGTDAWLAKDINNAGIAINEVVSGVNLTFAGVAGAAGGTATAYIGATVGYGSWRAMGVSGAVAGQRSSTLWRRVA